MSTNLRLLLDEAITEPLARLIRDSSNAITVEYMRELPIRSAKDDAVIDYAREHSRIVVTTESHMNHKTFPVCTHPGIIVLTGRRKHEDALADSFRKFLRSGRRQEAKDAVTFVSESEVRIKSHQGDANFKLE